MRFPAPAYTSTNRSRSVLSRSTNSGLRGTTTTGTSTGSNTTGKGSKLGRTLDTPGSAGTRTATPRAPRTTGSGQVGTGKAGSGGRIRYGSGPLQRLDPSRIRTRSVANGTRSSGTGSNGSGGAPRPGTSGASGVSGTANALDKTPRASLTPNAGYPVNSGAVGSGIAGSSYRGYGGIYHGVYNTFASCYYWGWQYYGGFYNPCWWGAWPYYFTCWFPYAWNYYRPYFNTVYVYSDPAPATTTQVIYVDETSGTGEGAVPEPSAKDRLPIAAERYLTLGDRAFREGRYTDAVQFYAKAVEYAPDQGGLFLVLSDALFAAGDYHYAAYAIRRAFELEPALAEATVDKRTFYSDPLDFETQLRTLEEYLVAHPSDRDARVVLGLNYHFSGRSAEAKTLLTGGSGLESDPAAIAMLATIQ